jgi:hypothetical protein
LKEEALDHTQWRTRFGRGYGPVVRQTTEWNEYVLNFKIFVRFIWFSEINLLWTWKATPCLNICSCRSMKPLACLGFHLGRYLQNEVNINCISVHRLTNQLCCLLGMHLIWISDGTPTILTVVLHDFPQSLQVNASTVPYIKPRLFSSMSFPITYSLIILSSDSV